MANRRDEMEMLTRAKAEAFVMNEGYRPELEFYAVDVYEIAVKFALAQRRELLEGLKAKVVAMPVISTFGGKLDGVYESIDKADVLKMLDGEGGCE